MNTRASAIAPQGQERLRFITCGSVDDGKSTLIGRLLYDSGQILDDQLLALESDSRRGGGGGALDFSLLVDGLEAEREQNITIDVAYRYFRTPARSFKVADTPGHEQYTRNMATGASTADLAVILIDSRKGVLTQTRRHARICALMGIKHVVLAVNKIDLVGYDRAVFSQIRSQFERFAADLGFQSIQSIPVSALLGDNVFRRSERAHWYDGPTLIEHLEAVEVVSELASKPLRMSVQIVRRPSSDMRVFSGVVASGSVVKGQQITVAVSGAVSTVKAIWGPDGDLERAEAGLAATVALTDEVDVARGDLLVSPHSRTFVADRFTAHLVWMGTEPLRPGKRHLMRIGTRWAFASVAELKYRLNINTGKREQADELAMNEIGMASLATDLPVAFDAYQENRATGAFILVDRDDNAIVAAGMIDSPYPDATRTTLGALAVDKVARSKLKGHRALCVWITGDSDAAKTRFAGALELELHRLGLHTALLDGDALRRDTNRPRKLRQTGRAPEFRRLSEAAALLTGAGLIVLALVDAATPDEREAVRALVPEGQYIELFIGGSGSATPKTAWPKGARPALRLVSDLGDVQAPQQRPEITIERGDEQWNAGPGGAPQLSQAVTYIARLTRLEPDPANVC